MEKTTLTKNKEGYGYKYTELAEIHRYLEENNMKYYQTIETNEHNGKDYIMTYRFIDGEWEKEAKRGCQIVDATLQGIKNPAQEQGSALTYARRYSLLMAFGLATEDDDAQSLSRSKEPMTLEKAKEYKITFGKKHPNETIEEILEKDKGYLDWCLESKNINAELKEAIKLIYQDKGIKILNEDEQKEKLVLMTQLNELFLKAGIEREKLLSHYEVDTDGDLTIEQLKDAISKLEKKVG